jgi:nitrosocyanin
VAVEIDGTKFWFPSSITVKKGDTVKIHAVSKVPGTPSVHGFSIPAYKVEVVADEKGKDVEFVADKAGIFPINCQLHPAHVGAQLIVLE